MIKYTELKQVFFMSLIASVILIIIELIWKSLLTVGDFGGVKRVLRRRRCRGCGAIQFSCKYKLGLILSQ